MWLLRPLVRHLEAARQRLGERGGRRGARAWARFAPAALGAAIVTAGAYVAGFRLTASAMLCLWVGLCAAYLLGRARAIGRIAETERSQRELEASLSLQRATLESIAEGILVVNREGRIVSFNRRFKEMWSIPDDVVESGRDGLAIASASGQLTDPAALGRKAEHVHERPEAETHDYLHLKDRRVFERSSRPQCGPDGRIHGRVWSFRDVTEHERIQSRLRHLADHDPLTGLLNRTRFDEALSDRVAHAARYDSGGAVLLLDIDDFKHVNDSLGHRTGDAVIRSVADLLGARVRETDVLARLGGDELAVLLPYADEQQARHVARKLVLALRAHRPKFGGERLRITASIGVALIAKARQRTAAQLVAEADLAVYRAKKSGRDRYCLYTRSEDRANDARNDDDSPDRIRSAIDGDRLALHAQPILDLTTDEISRYELLVRMIGDDGELLPPHAFLPIAERYGMAPEIDAWVTRRAIRLIERCGRAGRDLRVEVNISGRTLAHRALPRTIEEELRESPVDPGSLIFEVTETAAILNMDEAREFASELTRMGCRFALDDFGAGFGSFYYLEHLPLEFLKIDGDFIGDLPSNATDQAMVRAIVELARRLGKSTIAKFVSDGRTMELLREYGVDYAQGRQIGPPRPIAEVMPPSPVGVE